MKYADAAGGLCEIRAYEESDSDAHGQVWSTSREKKKTTWGIGTKCVYLPTDFNPGCMVRTYRSRACHGPGDATTSAFYTG